MSTGPIRFDELVVDDLDHDLARVEALDDLLAEGLLHHVVAELLDDLVVDVRLQQGRADLAHRLADVVLGDPPAAGHLAEDVAELFGQ